MPAIPRKPAPVRPFLPAAYPIERADQLLAETDPPAKLSFTLDGASVNLAQALAQCVAASINAQNRDLLARASGYIRTGTLPMVLSATVGDCIEIIRVVFTDDEAATKTLRNLHDDALRRFWDALDAQHAQRTAEA